MTRRLMLPTSYGCDKVTGRFEAVRSKDIAKNFKAFLAALTLYKRLKEIR